MHTRAGRHGWRIAVAVRRIGLAAGGSHVGTPRGLRELPCFGEGHAAAGGSWRRLGKSAARRRATLIVADKEANVAAAVMIANVVGRHHGDSIRLAKRNARTVHARTIASAHHAIDPGMNVGALLGQHAAALLLIEKED